MRYRVLIVGIDVDLLEIRQVLLKSWGYDSLIATTEDVEEKIQSGRFDLVIFSVTLSQEEKRRIQGELSPGTRTLVLKTQVWPEELRRTVAEASLATQPRLSQSEKHNKADDSFARIPQG